MPREQFHRGLQDVQDGVLEMGSMVDRQLERAMQALSSVARDAVPSTDAPSAIGAALLQAMQQSPPEWLWLLRLHPLRRHTAPEIAAILKAAGVANVEIEAPTALPLFSLLRIVEHHVTVFSSVTVEAAAFGLRTSLLGAEGPSTLAPQMKRGICRYTPTAESLMDHIHEVLSGPRAPFEDDFMEMSEGAVDRALGTILN